MNNYQTDRTVEPVILKAKTGKEAKIGQTCSIVYIDVAVFGAHKHTCIFCIHHGWVLSKGFVETFMEIPEAGDKHSSKHLKRTIHFPR